MQTSETIYERLTMFIFLLICIVHQFGNSFYGQQLLDAVRITITCSMYLFLGCYFCNNNYFQQESVTTALCNLPWYTFDIQTRKILVLVLARSNKRVVLNGGKMYHLRFESFVIVGINSMFKFEYRRYRYIKCFIFSSFWKRYSLITWYYVACRCNLTTNTTKKRF